MFCLTKILGGTGNPLEPNMIKFSLAVAINLEHGMAFMAIDETFGRIFPRSRTRRGIPLNIGLFLSHFKDETLILVFQG